MTTPFDPGAAYGYDLNKTMKSPGSTGGGTGMIYLGPNLDKLKDEHKIKGPYAPGYKGTPYLGANAAPYAEAINMPVDWDDKEKRDFVNKGILYKMPGFSPDMGMPEIVDAWKRLVDSAQTFSQGKADWSPWDVMESYKNDGKFGTVRRGDWLYDAGTGEKVKYVGPKTKTTTNRQVNLSSPEDVKALSTQMLSELLGRAPTTNELAQYKASINGFEEKNPEITTTTSTFDEQGEVTAQSSKTSGGASQAALGGLVSEAAQKGPEYGKYQSGTTYFNALMQMITGG